VWRLLVIGLVLPIFFSLLFGAIWSKRNTGQRGVLDKIGILFMIVINQAFGGMAEVRRSGGASEPFPL
jgi:hypothetical protein